MRPAPDEFTTLLTRHPKPVAALARGLRTAALKAMPDLTERFYPGWQGLGLVHPSGGLLGTLFLQNGHVIVYLERGASLPDPHGLLGGEGRLRRTRTLTFAPGQSVPNQEHLVEYLDLALDYAVTHRRR